MRYKTLDAVRGIAALIVVFHHAILILPGSFENRAALRAFGFDAPFAWLYLTPLRLLVAGPVAVYLFFVLSGFVLCISLARGGRETYGTFIIKRIARIWIPFAAAVTASAVLALLIQIPAPLTTSDWFKYTWSRPPEPMMLLRHFAMLGTDDSLDSPIWSLGHELRISLIFPVLVFLMRSRPATTSVVSIIILFSSIKLQSIPYLDPIVISLLTSLCYLPLFLLGIALALYRQHLMVFIGQIPSRFRVILWIFGLIGLSYSPVVSSSVARFNDGILLLINGAAASVLILMAIAPGRINNVLNKSTVVYLGTISYSLYLVHVVVFAIMIRLSGSYIPLAVSIILSIIVALIVARVNYRFVELPAAAWGNLLASRLNRPSFAQAEAYPKDSINPLV